MRRFVCIPFRRPSTGHAGAIVPGHELEGLEEQLAQNGGVVEALRSEVQRLTEQLAAGGVQSEALRLAVAEREAEVAGLQERLAGVEEEQRRVEEEREGSLRSLREELAAKAAALEQVEARLRSAEERRAIQGRLPTSPFFVL